MLKHQRKMNKRYKHDVLYIKFDEKIGQTKEAKYRYNNEYKENIQSIFFNNE